MTGVLLFLLKWVYSVDEADLVSREYIIRTQEDLRDFSKQVNAGFDYKGIRVVLEDDIDFMDSESFEPIGVNESGHYFNGIFDGQGHSIKNIRIDSEKGNANNGLFGVLGGTVCNLTIENAYIKGNECGVICFVDASAEVMIYNCAVINATIEAESTEGIWARYSAKHANCTYQNKVVGIEDGTGLESEKEILNQNLCHISSDIYNLPMNTWEIENDKLVLTKDTKEAISFSLSFMDNNLDSEIKSFYSVSDNTYYIVLPYPENVETGYLKATNYEGKEQGYQIDLSKEVDNRTNVSVDFCDDNYRISVIHMENTPSVFVTTNEKYADNLLRRDKNNFINGYVRVFNEDGTENYSGGLESIAGRGSHSWAWSEKKSFNLQLLKRANILNMGRAKSYVLMAGHRDASLLSYMFTMKMDKELDWDYAPDYQLANLYIDGEYTGLYILCEKMEIGDSRLNIDERVDDTGAYVYEMRADYYQEKTYFTVSSENTYLIRNPKFPSDGEFEYSTKLWDGFERAVFSQDGVNNEGYHFSDYIDMQSWARLMMMLELNGEQSIHGSLYFYKESDKKGDGKIHALPPWDVEHSFVMWNRIEDSILKDVNSVDNHGLLCDLCGKEEMIECQDKCYSEEIRPAALKLIEGKESKESYLWEIVKKYHGAAMANELRWGEAHNFDNKAKEIESWVEKRIEVLDRDYN